MSAKKSSRKPKPIILPAIRMELAARERSQLWLSRHQRGAHAATCQAYLYSGRDARVSTVESMMRRLDLVVVSKKDIAELKEFKKLKKQVDDGVLADVNRLCSGGSHS